MNEEMRKEFEAKTSELGFGEYENDFAIDEETGAYVNSDLNAMKVGFNIGWQASREAMKPIKFQAKSYVPIGMYKSDYDRGINEGIDMCKEAIRQVGYKVEE